MSEQISQEVTVLLKLCFACQAERLASDRFCRRCGVSQSSALNEKSPDKTTGEALHRKATASRLAVNEAVEYYVTDDGLLLSERPRAGYETTVLSKERFFRRVSGSLVNTLVASVSDSAAPYVNCRFA